MLFAEFLHVSTHHLPSEALAFWQRAPFSFWSFHKVELKPKDRCFQISGPLSGCSARSVHSITGPALGANGLDLGQTGTAWKVWESAPHSWCDSTAGTGINDGLNFSHKWKTSSGDGSVIAEIYMAGGGGRVTFQLRLVSIVYLPICLHPCIHLPTQHSRNMHT